MDFKKVKRNEKLKRNNSALLKENGFRCEECKKVYDTLDCSEEWDVCIFCFDKRKKERRVK